MTLNCDPPGPGGFQINRAFGDTGLIIAPLPAGSLIRAVNTHTNAGNALQRDLLPDALIKVDPAGTAGDITITFNPASEGAPLVIDNTPLVSQDTIADLIVAGFLARGFTGTTKETSPTWSHSPDRFAGGPFVRVPNVRKNGALLSFSIRGVPNQEIEVENLNATNIPALSTWGFGILTGLVLISTIVLLRR